MTTFLRIIFLLLLSGISNQLVLAGNCTIQGVVQNAGQHSIELQLFGDMVFPASSTFQKIDVKGKFQFDVDLKNATYAILKYASEEIPLYLEKNNRLELEFQDYEPFKTVKSKGDGSDNQEILWKCRRAFYPHRDNIVMHEMSRSEPESFYEYLEKTDVIRKNTWFGIPAQQKKKCSQTFLNFMMAELHYWKPYFALLYRRVKAASDGLTTNYALNAPFIRYFFHTHINFDKGIEHPYYAGFLEEYADWCTENPKSAAVIASSDNIANSFNKSISIYKEATCEQKITDIAGCQPLIWHSQDTMKAQVMPDGTLFSYWISTMDGVQGWVKSEEIQFSHPNLNTSDQIYENIVAVEKQVIRQCKVVMDNILVRKEPSEYYAIDTLKKEEVVTYLNQKTDNTYNYYHEGEIFVDNFYKIKTNNGRIGWVLSGAIVLQEVEQEIPVEHFVVKSGTESDWMDLDHYFVGQPKCFLACKWLIKKCLKQEPKLLLRYLYTFSQNNPYSNYFKAVDEIYLNAHKTWYPNEPLQDVLPKYSGSIPEPDDCSYLNEGGNIAYFTEKVAESFKDISEYPKILSLGVGQKEVTTLIWNAKDVHLSEKGFEVPLDPWNIDSKSYDIPNGEQKTTLLIPSDNIAISELTLDGHKIPIWLIQKDSVEIVWDGQADLHHFSIIGSNAPFHQYTIDAYSHFRIADLEAKAAVRDKSPSEYKQLIDDLYLQKLFYWENHPAYQVYKGSDFDRILRKELFYWKGFLLLNYPWEHPLLRQEAVPMPIDESWGNFIQKTDIEPINGFYSKNAAYFYTLYDDWLGLKEHKSGISTSILQWLDAKEILLDIKKKSKNEAISYVDKKLNNTLLESYFPYWCRQLLQKMDKQEQSKAANFELEDLSGNKIKLSDFANKVVVLDFWATYCAPCIASMSSQASTIEYWKNQPIVFVWISIDKEKEVWQSFLNKSIASGIHLWAGENTKLKSDFKVWYLPTSLIIDKNGYIVRQDKNLSFNQLLEQLVNQ